MVAAAAVGAGTADGENATDSQHADNLAKRHRRRKRGRLPAIPHRTKDAIADDSRSFLAGSDDGERDVASVVREAQRFRD
jgi:hypothetical protein